MNEQTNSAEETILNKENEQEISKDSNAEQTTPKESGNTSGQEKSEQIDFSQMYDMLTERDETIKKLTAEIGELKKTNTNLLLKVNASASTDGGMKNPYEKFVDSMVER